MQNIICEHPNVIFNRSSLKYIFHNGYYINKTYHRLTDEEKINFDFSMFNPYKCGCLTWLSPAEKKKPLLERKFKPVDDNIEKYYTFDFDGNKILIFLKVPCGHCVLCQSKKINEVSTQLLLESQCYDTMPLFFTLTYRDEYKPYDGVNKQHIQNFLKRLRNNLNQQFRYFIVSEYGTKSSLRPHYHGIIFGLNYDYTNQNDLDRIFNAFARSWSFDRRVKLGTGKNETETIFFMNRWQPVFKRQFGIIDVQPTNGRAFKYVSKYLLKKNNVPAGQNNNFVLRSNRYGLGFKFRIDDVKKVLFSNRIDMTVLNKWTGKTQKVIIPRSYRNKILPSNSRYISDRLRDVINNVNLYLSELYSYNYTFIKQLHSEFVMYNEQLKYLGYYVTPLKKMKITLCATKPYHFTYIRDFIPFSVDDEQLKYYHPRTLLLSPRRTFLLIKLKNFKRVLEEFSSKFNVTEYLKKYNTKLNINNTLSVALQSASTSAGYYKILHENKIFFENQKI